MVHEHFPSNRSPKIAGIEQFVLLYTIIEYFAAREQELSAEELVAEEPAPEVPALSGFVHTTAEEPESIVNLAVEEPTAEETAPEEAAPKTDEPRSRPDQHKTKKKKKNRPKKKTVGTFLSFIIA